MDEAARDLIRDESEFWTAASRPSLDAVWEDAGDDVYERLIEAPVA